MPLTQWVQDFWRNRKSRRAQRAMDRRVHLRVRRLGDRRVFTGASPVVTTTSGTVGYTENAVSPVTVDAAINVTDVDDANLTGATIQITANYANGQDFLAFTPVGNITGNFSGGTLTLSGVDTKANYIAALQSVTYQNTSENPNSTTRTIEYTVDDGTSTGSATRDVTVTAVNDAPTATITPTSYSATENVALTLQGTGLSIADVDAGTAAVRATLSVTSGIFNASAGTTGVTITGNGTATLTLDGTLTEINDLLAGNLSGTLTYTANVDAPPASTTLTLTASDLGNTGTGGTLTGSDTATINITAVNDAPVIANLAGDTLSYNEGAAATVIDQGGNATVTDADSTDFNTGTLSVDFAAGSDSTQDVLAIRNQGTAAGEIGVSGSNVTFGGVTIGTFTGGSSGAALVITFNAASTPAAAQALIRNITFRNTNANAPTAGDRTVRFTLSDGDGGGTVVNTTVTVIAVNDAPTATITPTSYAATENVALTLQGTGLSIADVDAGTAAVRATLTVTSGIFNASAGTTGVTISGNGTATLTLDGTLTQINDLLAGNLSGTLTYTADDDTPPASTTLTLTASDLGNTGTGGALTGSDTATINITAVNDAPVIANLSGDSLAYDEGDGAVVIDQGGNATVTDDSADFNTGTLTVSFTAGSDSAEDELAIRNQGTAAGQIGVSGSNVTFGGTTIGTFVGGTGGANLVITFNGNSTPAAAQALIRNITFEDTDTVTPTTGARTVRFVLTDGDGGSSGNHDTTVTVNAVNSVPVITNLSGDSLTYNEGASATVIEQGGNATVTDVDSTNFNTGTLTVSFTAGSDSAQDVLAIRDQGTAPGQIDISGSNVRFGGTTIGTFTGGSGGAALVITFNGNSTPTAAQALIRNITYRNTDTNAPTAGARTVRFVLTDGDGGSSGNHDTTVTVNAANDAPTATITPTSYSTTENVALSLTGGMSIADVDAGTAAVRATLTVDSGILNAAAGTTGVTITGNGTATLTLDGTLTEINDLLAGNLSGTLTYTADSDTPPTSATLTLTASDLGNTGTGGTLTASDTATINITAANDPPTLTTTGGTPTYTEGSAAVSLFSATTVSTVESGQTITRLDLTVSNVSDGNAEILRIDGTDIALVAGSGTTATNGFSYSVTGTTTVTVSLTKVAGVSTAATQTLVNGITYRNSSQAPSAGNRVVTLTRIDDNGSNTPPNDHTGTFSAAATVTVAAVNDAPTATITPTTYNATERTALSLTGGMSIADVDAGTAAVRATLTVTSGIFNAAAGTTGVTIGGDGTATLTLDGTLTQINNLLAGSLSGTLTYTADSDTPPASATLTLTASDLGNTGSGGTLTASDTATINITAVNSVPVITNLSGDSLSYDEGDGTVVIEQGGDATVTDADSSNFNTGTLTVSFTAGSDSTEDVLAIRNQGTAAGQIGVSGSNVTFGGVTIGTFTGGSSGAALVVTFTSTSATPAAAQALIRNITFQNTDTNAPTAGARTVRFVLTDGDGGSSGNQNTTVTVNAVNDGPTATITPTTYSATENISLSLTGGMSIADVDAGTAAVQATLTVTSGILIAGAGTTGVTIGGSGTATLTLDGTLTQINNLLAGNLGGTLTFTANSDTPPATATLTLTADDLGNTGSGALTASDTATINITAVNDAPTATITPATYSATEQTALSLTGGMSIADVDAGTAAVRATLTVTSGILTAGAGTTGVTIGGSGTATLTLDGTLTQINDLLAGNLGATLTYTANSDTPPVSATLTLTASDLGNTGSGGTRTDSDTATILITATNDPVVVTPNVASTNYTELTPPITLAPALDLSDVDGTTATEATITITSATYDTGNDVLSFTSPLLSGITGNYSGGVLTLSATVAATLAQFQEALRSVVFSNTSNNPSVTPRTIEFRVNDGSGLGTAGTMTVTITPLNDAPTISNPGTQAVSRSTTIGPLTVTVSDPDNSAASLVVTATSSNGTLFPPGSITIGGSGSSRTITLVPASGVNGFADITLSVDDQAGQPNSVTTTTFRVVVSDPPSLGVPGNFSVQEDFSPVFFVVTATDPEGQLLTFSFQSSDSSKVVAGGITMFPIGGGTYLVSAPLVTNANGNVTITLTATDQDGRSASSSFVLTITPVNDAPSVDPVPTVIVREDGSFTGTLTGQDGDPEVVQSLTFSVLSPPTRGTLSVLPNGQFTYTPNANYAGTDSFFVQVTDDSNAGGGPLSGTRFVVVTVTPVADAPTFSVTVPTITGVENVASGPGFTAVPSDTDGSESITSVLIENVPLIVSIVDASGVEYAHGFSGIHKTYLLTGAQFSAARIRALDNISSTLTITATSTENTFATLVADQTATTVQNVPINIANAPPRVVSFTGTDIAADARTSISATISDAPLDTFRVVITWGVSSIGFDQRTVLPFLGPSLATLNQGFTFLIAPDPRNPAAPVIITMEVTDKDGGVTTSSVTVNVIGTGIATTIVRDLGSVTSSVPQIIFVPEVPQPAQSATPPALRFDDDAHVSGERTIESTRVVILRVVTSQGVESAAAHRLPESVLTDLAKFLGKLPDGHYRLYLSESSFTPPRMLADVMMFRGRAVAPGDMQAHRPPTQHVAKLNGKLPPQPVVSSQPAVAGPQQEEQQEMPAPMGEGPQLIAPVPEKSSGGRDERGR